MTKRVPTGKSLQTLFPGVAAEWDYERNGSLTPSDVVAGTSRKVWWVCDKGPDHRWEAVVVSRTRIKAGCPCCAGKKASVTNSLAALFPEVAAQWDNEKNRPLTSSDVAAGSTKKYWWVCDKGPDHRWEAVVASRTRGGNGCPCCAGKKASVTNSLAALFPEVAAQWDNEKNSPLTPSDVVAGSNKKYWWRCDKGPDHVWEAAVTQRTYGGSGCPCCAGQKASVTNSLAVLYPDVAAEWDYERNDRSPSEVTAGSNRKYWWVCDEGPDHRWEAVVVSRTHDGRGCPCCVNQKVSVTNSLAALFPNLAQEFDSEKNGVTPDEVIAGSNKRFWWRCRKRCDICGEDAGHSWSTTANERAYHDRTGCPFCAGRKVGPHDSLAHRYPELAVEWDFDRNRITPDRIAPFSNKPCYWTCAKGPDHKWKALPNGRQRSGCPCCANKKVSVTNSLAAKRPDLVPQWHPTKNGDRTPWSVIAGSNALFWWQCPEGDDHVWRISASARTWLKGSGCPFCANLRVSKTNSLAAKRPDLVAQWHPTKNRGLTPDSVVARSNRKVWWKCPRVDSHEWPASPRKRTVENQGCPICPVYRSWNEVLLACDLGEFFEIDPHDRIIRCGERPLYVDIVLRSEGLIVEFDSVYWHKTLRDRAETDREKTELLESLGWRVLHLREEPLNKIRPHDLVVPVMGDKADRKAYKQLVDDVLLRLRQFLGKDIPGLEAYLEREDLVRWAEAESIYAKARHKGKPSLQMRLDLFPEAEFGPV